MGSSAPIGAKQNLCEFMTFASEKPPADLKPPVRHRTTRIPTLRLVSKDWSPFSIRKGAGHRRENNSFCGLSDHAACTRPVTAAFPINLCRSDVIMRQRPTPNIQGSDTRADDERCFNLNVPRDQRCSHYDSCGRTNRSELTAGHKLALVNYVIDR